MGDRTERTAPQALRSVCGVVVTTRHLGVRLSDLDAGRKFAGLRRT